MSIERIDSDTQKPKAQRFFEGVLLIICLCVLALRATYTESPFTVTINANQLLGNDAFSIILSTSLIFTALCWALIAFCRKQFVYRLSGIETGLVILLIASAFAYSAASNKRFAINDILTLTAPMAMAILLLQLLDSREKIKLVLFVTVALAVTATYQCTDQLFSTNQYMIEDYEKNPQRHLDMIGAEVGSLKQFQYEHRLYSKDIRGFLTTSNSTGSFLILAGFTAAGLFIQKLKNIQRPVSAGVIWFGAASAITIAGVFITRSKGAISATILAGGMLGVYLGLSKFIARHKIIILLLCVLLAVGAGILIVNYGVSHGRLPGGNSMLVRWQYWSGAAEMYRDHPLAGVGGANFAIHYPRYKIPAAPETVKDPHNFILSILTQYGPLGLLGFLAALIIPVCKTIFKSAPDVLQSSQIQKKTGPICVFALVFISLALFLLRPILIAADLGTRPDVKLYVILLLYLVPFCIFAAVFLILWQSEKKMPSVNNTSLAGLQPALFCGLVGVLIHNLIDFALFEPGVYTLFWTMLACLAAFNYQTGKFKSFSLTLPAAMRTISVIVLLVGGFSIIRGSIFPTVAASAKIQKAVQNPDSAGLFLKEAAQNDKLDPVPFNFAGRLYVQQYIHLPTRIMKDPGLLHMAVGYFLKAAQRDPENFKNYEKLSDTYKLMAENLSAEQKKEFLENAYENGVEAIHRYPGSDRIHFKLAKIAEELELVEIALTHYKKTVEIEDSYREQFRLMYPRREIFSRLGPANYQLAKDRIKELENLLDKRAEN